MNQPALILNKRAWLMPWLWVGVLFVAGVNVSIFPNLAVWNIGLVLPVSALLGWRYGHRGVAAVALGGLPLVVRWQYGVLSGGASLDIYLAALITCALAASSWPADSIPRLRIWPLGVLAFFFLPLSFGLYANDDGDLQYQVVLQFAALLYLFLFLLGAARYRMQLVIALLAAFTAFGILLELLQLPANAQELFGGTHAELPLLGYTRLRTLWVEYGLDSPAMFFTGLGWCFAGNQVAWLYETRGAVAPPWHRSYLPIVLLTVVGLGWEMQSYLTNSLTGNEPSPAFTLFGSFLALQCGALIGGLLLCWRGVLLVLLLLFGFLLLDALLRANFDIMNPRFLVHLSEPVAVLGFGALGIALRNRILGTNTVWWSWRWVTYVLIMAALVPALFSLDSALDLLWMLLTMIGAVVIGRWLAAMRKRYLGWLPAHGGWLALLGLGASMIIAVRNREFIVQLSATVGEWMTDNMASIQAGEGWYEPDGEIVIAVMFLLVGGALFLTVLQRFIINAPACRRDLVVLIRTMQGKPLPEGEPVLHQARPARWGWAHMRSFATRFLALARNITVMMIISVLVFQTVLALYPQDGIVATVRGWFAPELEETIEYDFDVAAADAKVNPWLWQAVRETFAQVPATFNEREGRLTTEWYSTASEPGRRQQVDIHVGEVLETYALTVNLRVQQRGLFGLWIEQGSYWDPRKREFVGFDPYQQQQELEDRLLVRARELAPGATD